MSRRSFPHIDPAALRDHADEARVERVWERIEHDLLDHVDRAPQVARARRSSFVYVAIAAAFGAFGAGVLLGKVTWGKPTVAEAPTATPIIEKSLIEVLAAGTQLRTFPLQGGGRLTLSPGATVEVERSGSALTLSLLQGAASIDSTGKALAIVVADARINTQAGSVLSVTRNANDLDVSVTRGSASVSSPAGERQLGENERAAEVPIHATVSSAPVSTVPRRSPVLAPHRATDPHPSVPKGANVPEWLSRQYVDEEGAAQILKKQGVNQAIDTAKSANWLQAIADIMRGKGHDQAAEIRALERLIQAFPRDQRAWLAAKRLAQIYGAQGNTLRAKEYQDKVQPLVQGATMGSDALMCELIRREPDKIKAAVLAKEYLGTHPDGECREEFERMVQAEAPAPADPPPAPPTTPATPAP